MQEYLDLWRNYFDFSGRTSVRGYWMAFLFNLLISMAVGFIDGLLGLGFLAGIYGLAIMIPSLAAAIRRLRDAGRHWAWYFINFVPLIGWIIFIVLLAQPSVAPPQQSSFSAGMDQFDY